MSPKIAIKQICPLTRSPTALGDAPTLCSGDACMMWRWKTKLEPASAEGYCGLAGQEGAP